MVDVFQCQPNLLQKAVKQLDLECDNDFERPFFDGSNIVNVVINQEFAVELFGALFELFYGNNNDRKPYNFQKSYFTAATHSMQKRFKSSPETNNSELPIKRVKQ